MHVIGTSELLYYTFSVNKMLEKLNSRRFVCEAMLMTHTNGQTVTRVMIFIWKGYRKFQCQTPTGFKGALGLGVSIYQPIYHTVSYIMLSRTKTNSAIRLHA